MSPISREQRLPRLQAKITGFILARAGRRCAVTRVYVRRRSTVVKCSFSSPPEFERSQTSCVSRKPYHGHSCTRSLNELLLMFREPFWSKIWSSFLTLCIEETYRVLGYETFRSLTGCFFMLRLISNLGTAIPPDLSSITEIIILTYCSTSRTQYEFSYSLEHHVSGKQH